MARDFWFSKFFINLSHIFAILLCNQDYHIRTSHSRSSVLAVAADCAITRRKDLQIGTVDCGMEWKWAVKGGGLPRLSDQVGRP